jgi:hypothetical protein
MPTVPDPLVGDLRRAGRLPLLVLRYVSRGPNRIARSISAIRREVL